MESLIILLPEPKTLKPFCQGANTQTVRQATFEDDLVGEAIAKRHSTTGEAVGIGARAGAYRTILTHFSQRYAKLPVIDNSFQVRLRLGSA